MKMLKIFVLLTLALAALVIATDGHGLVGRAYSCVFPTYRVERVAHTVRYGDTLYSIAYAYAGRQDKWDDLRGIICDIQAENGIADNDARWLTPGSRLIVPLRKEVKNND